MKMRYIEGLDFHYIFYRVTISYYLFNGGLPYFSSKHLPFENC